MVCCATRTCVRKASRGISEQASRCSRRGNRHLPRPHAGGVVALDDADRHRSHEICPPPQSVVTRASRARPPDDVERVRITGAEAGVSSRIQPSHCRSAYASTARGCWPGRASSSARQACPPSILVCGSAYGFVAIVVLCALMVFSRSSSHGGWPASY